MAWCEQHEIRLHHIQPGKLNQNAYIERSNRSLRREGFTAHLFANLSEVRKIIHDWMISYNEQRTHACLGNHPPKIYKQQLKNPQQLPPKALLLKCTVDGDSYKCSAENLSCGNSSWFSSLRSTQIPVTLARSSETYTLFMGIYNFTLSMLRSALARVPLCILKRIKKLIISENPNLRQLKNDEYAVTLQKNLDDLSQKPSAILYTSIPPTDEKFARRFIQEWNRAGFQICTVNSAAESETILSWNIPGLLAKSVECDASHHYGQPLVFIRDLVDLSRNDLEEYAVMGFVNADILPSPFQCWPQLCQLIRGKELHVFKRVEMTTLSNGKYHISPYTYRHGYGLMLWRSDHQIACGNEMMDSALGMPWWDYWLPFQHIFMGEKVVSHESSWIFHQTYKPSTNSHLFDKKGIEFLGYLQANKTSWLAEYSEQRDYTHEELIEFCTRCNERIEADQFIKSLEDASPKPDGISLVTACMNRNEGLLQAVNSWLPFKEITEIVIVDWSSSTKVEKTLAGIDDPRIRIVRVEGEPSWIASKAFTLALQEARYALTLKLDAEIMLESGFFEQHMPDGSQYFAGNWRSASNDLEISLNGSFFASSQFVEATGYYNKFITTYGWEDCELYSRLSKLAIRVDFNYAYIRHIEHESVERISNQAGKYGLHPLKVSPETETKLEILTNIYFAFLSPEWPWAANLAYDRKNSKALAYRYALIDKLKHPYWRDGVGLSFEALTELSLDGLFMLYAYRNDPKFEGTFDDFIEKLTRIRWLSTDATILSQYFRKTSNPERQLVFSSSLNRPAFRSKIRFIQTNMHPDLSGFLPSSMSEPVALPDYAARYEPNKTYGDPLTVWPPERGKHYVD